MTILSMTIIPAVYEDIKDNIFLLLGGNRNLWDNFYNLTLTMSALKMDIIANLEFWTTFFFLLYTIDYQEAKFPVWSYWGVFGGLLLVVLITDVIGYRSIKTIEKFSYSLFFTLRIILELCKIYIVVINWCERTIFLEDINQIDQTFMNSSNI